MGKYTAEQKLQLLNNLDLETSHRIQRLESWLLDHLTNFRIRQEGLMTHIPKSLRNMPMRDFAKYNGDIKKAVQGLQAQSYGQVEGIDKTTRKRKWIESQEQEQEAEQRAAEESAKPVKNARMTAATPKKASGISGNPIRGRLPSLKTPAHTRTGHRLPIAATPSPHKLAVPRPLPPAFPSSRPPSPSKSRIPFPSTSPTKARPAAPSTSYFNPAIPGSSSSTYPRWPRKDENVLSVNGSPLANPLALDLSTWFLQKSEADNDKPEGIRSKVAFQSRARTTSIVVRPSSTSSHIKPSHSSTKSSSFTPNQNAPKQDEGEKPVAALVSVPTADGHLLEFDPFRTSPGEIDALEGITNSAKKKAKEDMRSLVKEAVERWRID
ncbi:hypothetical protein BDY19DRAFT_985904 [Irpex rosettiformis]|uniref:Uncharacterized protein n=1 Tax=Irpex rosettiformis TaxID=378272 RepID=A0ACB8U0E2_9APHY|nr:hypothetical protein BDY19DRAFT_985904 [Irpex rosettiformis]